MLFVNHIHMDPGQRHRPQLLEDLLTGGEAKGKSLFNGVEERGKKEIAILWKNLPEMTVGGKKMTCFGRAWDRN